LKGLEGGGSRRSKTATPGKVPEKKEGPSESGETGKWGAAWGKRGKKRKNVTEEGKAKTGLPLGKEAPVTSIGEKRDAKNKRNKKK